MILVCFLYNVKLSCCFVSSSSSYLSLLNSFYILSSFSFYSFIYYFTSTLFDFFSDLSILLFGFDLFPSHFSLVISISCCLSSHFIRSSFKFSSLKPILCCCIRDSISIDIVIFIFISCVFSGYFPHLSPPPPPPPFIIFPFFPYSFLFYVNRCERLFSISMILTLHIFIFYLLVSLRFMSLTLLFLLTDVFFILPAYVSFIYVSLCLSLIPCYLQFLSSHPLTPLYISNSIFHF